jgi:hypothetical protein
VLAEKALDYQGSDHIVCFSPIAGVVAGSKPRECRCQRCIL